MLSLNKKYKGYYTKRVNDVNGVPIRVTVLKNLNEDKKSAIGWSGVIEKYSHTTKDFEGTKVEMFDSIFYYPALTKKETYRAIENFIINEL